MSALKAAAWLFGSWFIAAGVTEILSSIAYGYITVGTLLLTGAAISEKPKPKKRKSEPQDNFLGWLRGEHG